MISVLVPTANRPGFLRNAIASIKNQSRRDLIGELIVSDNGVSDVSKVVEEFDSLTITHVKQDPLLRPGEHYSWLVNNARCQWVAMLADDDMWGRYHLEEAARLIEKYPDAIAIFNQTVAVRNACRQPIDGYAQLTHSFIADQNCIFDDAFVFQRGELLLDTLIRTPLNIWSMVGRKSAVRENLEVLSAPDPGIDSDRYFIWRLNAGGSIVAAREIGLFMRCHPQMIGTVLESQDGKRLGDITKRYSSNIIADARSQGVSVEDEWSAFWSQLSPEDQEAVLRQSYNGCVEFACRLLGSGPLSRLSRMGLRNRLISIAKDFLPPIVTRALIKYRNRAH